MLKVLIDILDTNRQAFLQAPLPFISIGMIGFVIGLAFSKNQNETLKERLSLKDDKIKEKDEEIMRLKSEAENVQASTQRNQSFTSEEDNYANQLIQYSNNKLSDEAEKMARKLERAIQRLYSKLSEEREEEDFDPALYNEWLHEGPKLLCIKQEILKRLPSNLENKLDKISDSCYKTPAFKSDIILEAICEIRELGLAISQFEK